MTPIHQHIRHSFTLPVTSAAWSAWGCSLFAGLSLVGCAPEQSGVSLLDSAASPRPAIVHRDRSRPGSAVAHINGQPIALDQLINTMLEAAGGQALRDLILDRMLADESKRHGIRISAQDIEQERDEFIETLTAARLTQPDDRMGHRAPDAAALLDQVRHARGLGADRFARILRQSATLRAMVRDEVIVTDDMIALVHAIEHGEKRAAHIITTNTLAEAQQVIDALNAGRSFLEVAAQRSSDTSADRGGLIEPISPVDPSYPESIRSTLTSLTPGQISGPVAIDTGFAILRLDRIHPPDGVLIAQSRETLSRRIRSQQERQKMSELANRLMQRATTTVLDPHLRFSFEDR